VQSEGRAPCLIQSLDPGSFLNTAKDEKEGKEGEKDKKEGFLFTFFGTLILIARIPPKWSKIG